MGAEIPKGCLLVGPPGTGKTLLAKVCAGESNVPFYYYSASEFINGYVGVGAKHISQLFLEAKLNAPSIIFIDELEAIGSKRDIKFGNPEAVNTLNQLLICMDGFEKNQNVIVFGATNLPDTLDPALTRSKRFDRNIFINLPNKESRVEILNVYLDKIMIEKNNQIYISNFIANVTSGMSGAELQNICNEAAIFASREKSDLVHLKHFQQAVQRITQGINSQHLENKEQRKLICVYEAGKAVMSWYSQTLNPVLLLSSLEKSKYKAERSQYLMKDQNLQFETELRERIQFYLAGKIALDQIKKTQTTLHKQDFKKARDLAKQMIEFMGMGSTTILVSSKNEYQTQESQKTNYQQDQLIGKLITDCYYLACETIKNNLKPIETLSNLLFEKETLSYEQIVSVLGIRQH